MPTGSAGAVTGLFHTASNEQSIDYALEENHAAALAAATVKTGEGSEPGSEQHAEEDLHSGSDKEPDHPAADPKNEALKRRWKDTIRGSKIIGSDLEDLTWKKFAAKILESPKFDFFIGIIIVLNAANIGLEQTSRKTGEFTLVTETVEHICLSIYTLELVLRIIVFRRKCLDDGWVRFDFVLVVLGVSTQWIVQPIFGTIDEVGPLMVLRTARLLRLAKTVRLLIRFRELWMLVRGLLSSANTMLYTLLLLFVILYIFSCLIMELLYDHRSLSGPDADEAFIAVVEEYFPNLQTSMLSLLQFVCFDNIMLIYRPLAKEDALLLLYFICVILVVGIVVMNLVTAVIVNSALEQTAQDKDLMKNLEEQRKKRVLKDLRKMFERLDDDGSGQLSREEIGSVEEADKQLLANLTNCDDACEIFDVLDVDGSGDIGIEEFCDGLWQVAISKTSLEMKRMERQVERIRRDCRDLTLNQADIKESLDFLTQQLARAGIGDGCEADACYKGDGKSSNGSTTTGGTGGSRQFTGGADPATPSSPSNFRDRQQRQQQQQQQELVQAAVAEALRQLGICSQPAEAALGAQSASTERTEPGDASPAPLQTAETSDVSETSETLRLQPLQTAETSEGSETSETLRQLQIPPLPSEDDQAGLRSTVIPSALMWRKREL